MHKKPWNRELFQVSYANAQTGWDRILCLLILFLELIIFICIFQPFRIIIFRLKSFISGFLVFSSTTYPTFEARASAVAVYELKHKRLHRLFALNLTQTDKCFQSETLQGSPDSFRSSCRLFLFFHFWQRTLGKRHRREKSGPNQIFFIFAAFTFNYLG